MDVDYHIVIPARFASTRLSGKVLADIAGKPMLQHVYERAKESSAQSVTIATDDQHVMAVAEEFGANVCMTSPDHQSGTERMAEAVVAMGLEEEDIVVNLQADMPLILPELIDQVASDLAEHTNVKVSTLCQPITNSQDLFNPNVVKVVRNKRGYAMYFSRAPIPWDRSSFEDHAHIKLEGLYFSHIGIYAFRVGFLHEYMQWEPCPLEVATSLEQLRILWYGGRIHVAEAVKSIPHNVDTEEDLQRTRVIFKERA